MAILQGMFSNVGILGVDKARQGPIVPYARTEETRLGKWVDVRLIQGGAEKRAVSFKPGPDGKTTLAYFPK